MKSGILFLSMMCGVGVAVAQPAPPGGPPQNQNYGSGTQAPAGGYGYTNNSGGASGYGYQNNNQNNRYGQPGTYQNNNYAQGGMTFSNRNGQTFSVDQLAGQLRNLENDVQQALPALTAFNETFVTGTSGSSAGGLGGALSNLVSGVLNRNSSQASSPALSNLVAALHSQGNYNSQNPVTVSQNTPRDLTTLQDDLNRLPPVFQSLGVTASASSPPSPSQVISSPNRYGNTYQTNQPYPPTGR